MNYVKPEIEVVVLDKELIITLESGVDDGSDATPWNLEI